ncbi:MAG: ThiF family adenylyltransferase [Planctomycetes bacterium]|nr:ThiF family adenylyltransferase [Planctomycetota bacterium]
MDSQTLFSRISKLFNVGALSESRVLIAGCGSGGGQVAMQLVMSGVRRFSLFDADAMEPENVIRHVCGIRYLGQRKVHAVADVLLDRNPEAEVDCFDEDLMTSNSIVGEIAKSTVVVIATDNEPTRFKLNDLCVQSGKPFVIARVFTRGIGGEAFAFRPQESGCLACLETVLERTQYRDGIHEIDLVSDEERNKLYGMEIEEIKDTPGLNVDISFITSFHTRFVLDSIIRSLSGPRPLLPPIEENYVVWGNRPIHPFTKHFQIQRISLHPQDGCLVCSNQGIGE